MGTGLSQALFDNPVQFGANTKPTEAFGEVNPGQPVVVAGAAKSNIVHGLRIVGGQKLVDRGHDALSGGISGWRCLRCGHGISSIMRRSLNDYFSERLLNERLPATIDHRRSGFMSDRSVLREFASHHGMNDGARFNIDRPSEFSMQRTGLGEALS